MKLNNSEESYGLIHQALHWATALLILSLLPMGVYMHELPMQNTAQINDKVWLYSLHKTLGISALTVAVLRIIWAKSQPHPRPLHGGMEGFAASTVHNLLYVAIIAMPVMGWLHHAAAEGFAPIWWPLSQDLPFIPKSVELSNFFKTAHFITGIVLVVSLFLHIAGAVKHVVIDKDDTLSRMVPGVYQETGQLPVEQPKSASPKLVALLAIVVAIAAVFIVDNINTPATKQVETANASSNNAEQAIEGAWVIDYASSELAISVTQLGTPIKGIFSDWSADVVFDPENPENGFITASVGIASLSLGDVSERAISAEFLGAEANPKASFISEDITKTETGFAAQGIMTLAGVAQDFTIEFTFDETDGKANVSATGKIQRLDFKIGETFADDSSVGRSIDLNIAIDATRP
jgi:cytochrome b561/polyisoprenoid-binding protein YceI